ncbi:MAG: hypothetical protein GY906_15710 [bacterium]|nr:hypothetical protein [bacterium]
MTTTRASTGAYYRLSFEATGIHFERAPPILIVIAIVIVIVFLTRSPPYDDDEDDDDEGQRGYLLQALLRSRRPRYERILLIPIAIPIPIAIDS